jgi:hypothetical protein
MIMAAKKKTPSAADFRKKEEADKKKMKSYSSGPTYNGKTVNWDKTGTRKPTEAITQKGQKATGLAKPTNQNRFSSTAKTKISTGPFANSGNPNSKQFNVTKGNVANAALTAVGGASVGKALVKPIVTKIASQAAKEAAKKAASSAQKATNAAIKARTDRYYNSLLDKALKASPNGRISGKDLMDIGRRAEVMAKQVTKKK